VAQRRSRQEAAHGVERLRLDRPPPDRFGLVTARELLGRPTSEAIETLRVQREDPLHRPRVRLAQALVAVVAVAARGQLAVIGDVARRLLEVGGQPPPLEHFRDDVRHPLAGEVGAADLSDRVVAELDEDALVKALSSLSA
jgi:hypothetical protein